MASRPSTAERILDAALQRFNHKGYAATTLTEIAASIGIAQGNLTYHFPTKRDLVTRIQEQVAEQVAARQATPRPADIEDAYVDRLQFVMGLTATYRFLLRDDAQIEPGPDHRTPHQVLVDDYAALRALIDRVDGEGLIRQDVDVDLDVLTRSLWVIGRYWMDHLSEMELRTELSRQDQHRGMTQHLAVLTPNLTAAGRRRFEAAAARVSPAVSP